LLLGRRYSQDYLVKAIELCLEYRAIDSSAVENILHQLTASEVIFDEELTKNLLSKVEVTTWDCDLSGYAELTQEAVQ